MAVILGSTAATVTTPPVYNVKDYGALGDYSHDDTAAIQAAMNALKANLNPVSGHAGGQTLYFPPGYYKTTSTLDFTTLREVRILGGGGRGGFGANGNPSATIAFLPGAASTATAVNVRNSVGVIWDGVAVVSRSQNYNGTLLDFDSTGGSGGGDAFGNRVQNCVLDGFSGCNDLLSLAGNIEFSADNVSFRSGPVRMVDPSGGVATWSNANSFRSCSFFGDRTYSIINPGPQTTLLDCTFEPPAGTNVPAPIAYLALGNEPAGPLAVVGCGFWDTTGSGGAWVTSSVATSAFHFAGSRLGIGPGGTFFNLSAHNGLSISGCRFQAENGGTPNIFTPGQNITNGVMNGCHVVSPVVDNHASVFV